MRKALSVALLLVLLCSMSAVRKRLLARWIMQPGAQTCRLFPRGNGHVENRRPAKRR